DIPAKVIIIQPSSSKSEGSDNKFEETENKSYNRIYMVPMAITSIVVTPTTKKNIKYKKTPKI
ncbi:16792_t:CDS:1, partial [Gigaspora margarita]